MDGVSAGDAAAEQGTGGSFVTVLSMILATIVFIFIWYCNKDAEEKKKEKPKDNNKVNKVSLKEEIKQSTPVEDVESKVEKKEAVVEPAQTVVVEPSVPSKKEVEIQDEVPSKKVVEVEEEISTQEATHIEDLDEGFLNKLEETKGEAVSVTEESTRLVTNVAPSNVKTDGTPEEKSDATPVSTKDEGFVLVNEATEDSKTSAAAVPSGTTSYEIDVTTGDVSGAGTDANVFIIVYGDDKDTGKILLEKPTSKNKHMFEREQTDSFIETAPNVGRLNKIRVGHDNKGGFAGWYLDTVTVNIPSLNTKWTCPAKRWLDKKEGDKQIECDIFPTLVEETYVDIIYEEVKLEDLDSLKQSDVTTTDKDGDTTVSVRTGHEVAEDGTKMVVEEITTTTTSHEVETHLNIKSNIPSSVVDVEEVVSPQEVPEVESGNDDFLDQLVADTDVSISVGKKDDEEVISRELVPEVESCQPDILAEDEGKSGSDAVLQANADSLVQSVFETVASTLTTYNIDVRTGDKSGAGTDANVFIILAGDKCTTDKIVLEESKTNKKMFERDQVDSFTIGCVDVGNIEKITIGHDNKGGFAGWYLADVVVSSPNMADRLTFVADRWLDKKEADKKLEVELFPLETKDVNITTQASFIDVAVEQKPVDGGVEEELISFETTTEVHNEDEAFLDKLDQEYSPDVQETVTSTITMTTYDIDVRTGKKSGAGTDANVFIIIVGDKCTTDKIVLKGSKTHKKMFERDQVDSFTIESVDVGYIQKITIGHDNKGGFAGWYLADVVISNSDMVNKLTFVADRWLDKKEADKKLEVELFPQEKQVNKVDLMATKTGSGSEDSADEVDEDEALKLFQKFDVDGDGRITMEEFMAKLKKEKKRKKKEKKERKREKKAKRKSEAESSDSVPSSDDHHV